MSAPFARPITDRELHWMRHIAVHGPQSSEFLLEVCADTHRCRDTGLRALQKLRETGFLRLPPQQNQIAKADFNPHVYDLTSKAELHLKGLGDPTTVRPTGHWWHGFLTSSITSAIEIEAQKSGYRYIPAHEILNRRGATLAVPMGRQKLIPDQLFAIDYGGKYRSFVLEVDRGTEPFRSEAARKSLCRMIQAYSDLTIKDGLRQHYGLKSTPLILASFNCPVRASRSIKLLKKSEQTLQTSCCVKALPDCFPRFEVFKDAILRRWMRTGDRQFCLFET